MIHFRLYIVRHGETEWNKSGRIQGHEDVELNDVGLGQAGMLAQALKDVPFSKGFTSDLQRASKTAETILQHRPDVILERDEALRERYMGELQGEIGRSKKPAPSLEMPEALIQRCQGWYNRSIVGYMMSSIKKGLADGEPQSLLVVSHGGLISTLLRSLVVGKAINCAQGLSIGNYLNTGVSIIDYTVVTEGKVKYLVGTMIKYSDTAHLKDTRRIEVNADELVG
ncbi:phosphoglycerate mutase-like protein [Phlebopus sp. FC_14]|nr:phosphoglycerate mutase-like protein [Phlebopus sp. FC_14]